MCVPCQGIVRQGPRATDGIDSVSTRLELRELVDAYALAVDRKEPEGVASLFSMDGRLVTLFGHGSVESPFVRQGRDAIASALTIGLAEYVSTTHVVASHLASVIGDSAVGETRCLAHHVYEREKHRRLLVMAVHYEDRYVREESRWCFGERRLSVDWRQDASLGDT